MSSANSHPDRDPCWHRNPDAFPSETIFEGRPTRVPTEHFSSSLRNSSMKGLLGVRIYIYIYIYIFQRVKLSGKLRLFFASKKKVRQEWFCSNDNFYSRPENSSWRKIILAPQGCVNNNFSFKVIIPLVFFSLSFFHFFFFLSGILDDSVVPSTIMQSGVNEIFNSIGAYLSLWRVCTIFVYDFFFFFCVKDPWNFDLIFMDFVITTTRSGIFGVLSLWGKRLCWLASLHVRDTCVKYLRDTTAFDPFPLYSIYGRMYWLALLA